MAMSLEFEMPNSVLSHSNSRWVPEFADRRPAGPNGARTRACGVGWLPPSHP